MNKIKGFADVWLWLSPIEIREKKSLAKSMGYPTPDCKKFCYNSNFRIMFFDRQTEWGYVEHLMISRHDNKRIDNHWNTLQRIKNEVMGEDRLAVEVYPPVSELINATNAYHLWVLPENFKLPFGLNPGWAGINDF